MTAAFAGGMAITLGMMLHERSKQLPLLDAHKSLVQLGMLLKVLGRFLRLIVILRIIKHRRTHTVLSLFTHEDIVVDTALASGPESVILSQFRIGDGLITQLGVDLHDGQTRR